MIKIYACLPDDFCIQIKSAKNKYLHICMFVIYLGSTETNYKHEQKIRKDK